MYTRGSDRVWVDIFGAGRVRVWVASSHRRRLARGMQWVHLHPQGGETNFFRPNLQEKICKCTPTTRSAPASQSYSQFLGQFLLGGLDWGYIYTVFEGDD